MPPSYILQQTRLDKADYWARTVWKQLQPIYLNSGVIRPLETIQNIIEYPQRMKRFSSNNAHSWAWDSLYGWILPLKDPRNKL